MGPPNMNKALLAALLALTLCTSWIWREEYISPQNPDHILESLKILVYAHLVFSHGIHIPGSLNQMAFDSVLICWALNCSKREPNATPVLLPVLPCDCLRGGDILQKHG